MSLSEIKLQATLLFEKYFLSNDISQVYSLIGGPIFFQSLRSAIELGLFDYIDQEKKVDFEKLRLKLQLQEQPLRILMTSLVYLKLLKKSGTSYVNTRITKICFCTSSPKNIIEIVRWQHSINYPTMFHYLESLQKNTNVGLQEIPGKGDTLYERLAQNKPLELIFQKAMVQISKQANALLRDFLPLQKIRRIVDVGGGLGENVINLTSKWPELQGCVFDLPSVCELAEKNFKSYPHLKLSTFAGNCFTDAIPKGFDAILFCHFLTIWSQEKNILLLKKAFASLAPGGQVIIFNMMQNNEEDGPSGAALGSPYFQTLATGEGMLYTWSDYRNMLAEAGFSNIHQKELPSQHGFLIGIK